AVRSELKHLSASSATFPGSYAVAPLWVNAPRQEPEGCASATVEDMGWRRRTRGRPHEPEPTILPGAGRRGDRTRTRHSRPRRGRDRPESERGREGPLRPVLHAMPRRWRGAREGGVEQYQAASRSPDLRGAPWRNLPGRRLAG